MVEQLPPIDFTTGERFHVEANFYDYGAVSVKLELPFASDWEGLIDLASRWIADTELQMIARAAVKQRLSNVVDALVRPNQDWLFEDYYVVHLHNRRNEDGRFVFHSAELIAKHGDDIARIVRGERTILSDGEVTEILASRMSYHPDDLLVSGWTAAFLCETQEGADYTVQLLEYANTQLLAFRYYDAVLTRVLDQVYASLEKRGGPLSRWRLVREARSLNRLRLDVRELTDRIDTSIKFVSDMFAARQYKVAATKIGVQDYRRLVESKLAAAGDLYTFMMDQFYASRGFAMELIVAILILLELTFALFGRH